MRRSHFWIVLLFVVAAATLRLVHLPWNFAPVGAMALFAGTHFRNRCFALATVLVVLFASDLAIGIVLHDMPYYSFHSQMPATYACFLLYAVLGFGVRGVWNRLDRAQGSGIEMRVTSVGVAAFAGSLLFFFITNFACWLQMYEHTWTGLGQCYALAVPFYRNTLLGDMFYSAALFGGFAVVQAAARPAQAEPSASFDQPA